MRGTRANLLKEVRSEVGVIELKSLQKGGGNNDILCLGGQELCARGVKEASCVPNQLGGRSKGGGRRMNKSEGPLGEGLSENLREDGGGH